MNILEDQDKIVDSVKEEDIVKFDAVWAEGIANKLDDKLFNGRYANSRWYNKPAADKTPLDRCGDPVTIGKWYHHTYLRYKTAEIESVYVIGFTDTKIRIVSSRGKTIMDKSLAGMLVPIDDKYIQQASSITS